MTNDPNPTPPRFRVGDKVTLYGEAATIISVYPAPSSPKCRPRKTMYTISPDAYPNVTLGGFPESDLAKIEP